MHTERHVHGCGQGLIRRVPNDNVAPIPSYEALVVAHFRMLVDSGALLPHIPTTFRFVRRDVLDRLDALVRDQNPDGKYALHAQPIRAVPRAMLTDSDVAKLEMVCANARERAVFHFLSEHGLRREAITNLRIETVWDGERLRDRFYVLEKNARYRVVRPCPGGPLETALTEWLRDHPRQPGMFLFPHHRCPFSRAPGLVLEVSCASAKKLKATCCCLCSMKLCFHPT